MMHLKRTAALLATLALSTAAALANTVSFSFNFSGSGQSGSGVFTTATTSVANAYVITGVSGMLDGAAIQSMLAPGRYPVGFANDDLLFYSPTQSLAAFDLFGVSFVNVDGRYLNLFSATPACGSSEYYFVTGKNLLSSTNGGAVSTFTLTPIAPTPEPSSMLLLGTGVVALAGMAKKRMLRPAVTAC